MMTILPLSGAPTMSPPSPCCTGCLSAYAWLTSLATHILLLLSVVAVRLVLAMFFIQRLGRDSRQ